MKWLEDKVKIYLLLLVLFPLLSCEEKNNPEIASVVTHKFNVDLQGGFAKSHVILTIDNRNYFAGIFTTDSLLGFAGRLNYSLASGPHRLDIQLPDEASQAYTFFAQPPQETWVGLNFDRSSHKFNFIFSSKPFPYR